MNKKGSLIFFLLFFVLANHSFAADRELDSLKNLLTKAETDSARSYIYTKIASRCQDVDPQRSIPFVDSAMKTAETSKNQYAISNALNQYGIIYFNRQDYEKSLGYYLRSLKIREELKNEKLIAGSYNNIGRIYEYMGNYPLALDYYMKALETNRRIKNVNWENINLINIGNVYGRQNNMKEAKKYFELSLDLSKKTNDERNMAFACSNLSIVYSQIGDMNKALEMANKALELRKKSGSLPGIASSYQNLSDLMRKKKDFGKALGYGILAVDFSKKAGDPESLTLSYGTLADIYYEIKDFNNASEYYKKYIALNDSVSKMESAKTIAEMQTRYDSEKKEAEIVTLKNQKELNDLLVSNQDKELSRQRWIIYSVAGGFLLLVLFAVMLMRSNDIKKKANAELAIAYRQIEEKNKDITDSIRYAKRIQDTILPPDQLMEELMPGSFILFKPRDIVSGDFYWLYNKNNCIYLAAVDCTGHGVPGAFMSIVASNLLNKALTEKNILQPSLILDFINEELGNQATAVTEQFHFKDGMDISLCKIDREKRTLDFAGANNDLWILRNKELQVLKSNKMSVDGTQTADRKFSAQHFDLEKDDRIYLFTDGFADQFGGDKGKKLKYKNLQKRIVEMAGLGMKAQKESLEKFLEQWMGEHEQVDDILVMGFSV